MAEAAITAEELHGPSAKEVSEATDPGELLLQAARSNNLTMVKDLIDEANKKKITLDINCQGQTKKNKSWTPLHLATYFGHHAVAEFLLQNGANPDSTNDAGDTPLHKAAYTGRSELVNLLLKYKASVQIVNGEGLRASQMAPVDGDIRPHLECVVKHQLQNSERELILAAKQGDVDKIRQLVSPTSRQRDPNLRQMQPPSVNCVDLVGNTPLHYASLSNQKQAVVMLLQHGADPAQLNVRGQTAGDVANRDVKLEKLLKLTPNRSQLQRTVRKAEGFIMKKSRMSGWKPFWLHIERGVLSVFESRADCASGVNRKAFKYLDHAKVEACAKDKVSFVVTYNDNQSHILAVVSDAVAGRGGAPLIHGVNSAADLSMGNGAFDPPDVTRRKWMTCIEDHIKFSNYYIRTGMDLESDGLVSQDESLKMGDLADAFTTAKAHQQSLDSQVRDFTTSIENVMDQKFWKSFNEATSPTSPISSSASSSKRSLSSDLSTMSISLVQVRHRVSQLKESGRQMVDALSQCLTLMEQQEEARNAEAKEASERIRLLTDSLKILAEQHHELEMSLGGYLPQSADRPNADVADGEGDQVVELRAGGAPAVAASRSNSRRTSMVCVSDSTEEYYDIEDDMTMISYHSFASDEDHSHLEEVFGELDLDKTPTDELDFELDKSPVKMNNGVVEENNKVTAENGSAGIDEEVAEAESLQSTPKAQRKTQPNGAAAATADQQNDKLRGVLLNGHSDGVMAAELMKFDIGDAILDTSVESIDGRSCVSTSTTRSDLFHDARDSPPIDDEPVAGDVANGSEDVKKMNGESGEITNAEVDTVNGDTAPDDDEDQVVRRASIASLPFEPSAEQRARYPMFGRELLPSTMLPRSNFSVWSILKQCIGRDLSQITMPVVFNEPLSMLQRIAENMEYAILLDKAAAEKSFLGRLQYVAAFAASAHASNFERLGKPFNPILGETYELRRDDYCFIAEQVSHHPPISAFHAESPDWKFHGSVAPKIRFWGKSLEVQPQGTFTVELLDYGEAYSWSNVSCCVHNIIVGKLWIEHYGCLEVETHRLDGPIHDSPEKYVAVMNFKPGGWAGADLHKIEGFIMDKQKRRVRSLHGKWTDSLWTMDSRDSRLFVDNESLFNGVILSKSESSIAYNAQKTYEEQLPANHASARENEQQLASFETKGDGTNRGNFDATSTSPEVPRSALPLPDGVDVPEIHHLPSAFCLWKADPRPDQSELYFNFTRFAMMLNELDPDQTNRLPRTDSRFRPDIRALENGDLDEAAKEKHRLEEKQRALRRNMKRECRAWNSLWFELGTNPVTGAQDWIFNTDYCRRDWRMAPDLF